MDFKQLLSFVSVVKYKSFTRAAEKTGQSQPTISSHIRLLEEELQTQLIVRTTKSLEVTRCGRELYDYASNVLKSRDRLVRRWNDDARQIVQMGVSTIPTAYILPEVLPSFTEQYPDIRFVIHQADSHGVVEGLLSGIYDIGFIGMKYRDDRVICTPFYKDRMVLITPNREDLRELQGTPDGVQTVLSREPVILRELPADTQVRSDRILTGLGFEDEDLNVAARINDQESIKNLVTGNLGVSIVSEKSAAAYVQDGRVLQFELPEEVSVRYLYVVSRSNYQFNTNAQLFADFIVEHYRNEM